MYMCVCIYIYIYNDMAFCFLSVSYRGSGLYESQDEVVSLLGVSPMRNIFRWKKACIVLIRSIEKW
jgi:hypothetical protein